MIELRAVTAGGFHEASFVLDPGESCRLLLASDADLTLFLRLLVGTARPIEGRVLLFGREVAGLAEPEALALFSRLGLVWPGGGFVSNLKVWENILLPLWYHGEEEPERREDELVELLRRIGMAPDRVPVFLGSLPGSLRAHEQRTIGVVRAMMQDAEAMIYAGIFDGLDGLTRARLLEETSRHQTRRAGRASLFVAAGKQGLPQPHDGRSLRQAGDGGIEPWP